MPGEGEAQGGGVQSLDSALLLLSTLAARNGGASLSDLARACGMTPSKAHRYLKSFLNAGFVEQAGRSAKYDLGPAALNLGLSAIARHSFVNRASDGLKDLSQETGMSALLSVWGNEGATVIRWERAESPTVTSMGLGTTMPLLNSATGRAFLAWAPQAPLRTNLARELDRARGSPGLLADIAPTEEGVRSLVASTRTRGFARAQGYFIPGLVALAAPVLDWQGEAQAVVTLIGTDPTATETGAPQAEQLVAFCQSLSFAPIAESAA